MARGKTNAASAKTEAARSAQVARFLKEMLSGVGPSVAAGRDTAMLREILDTTAARLSEDLNDQPAVELELRFIIGNVYLELRDYASAAEMHEAALKLAKVVYGNDHPQVAVSLKSLGSALMHQGKLTEAETLHRQALEMQRKWLGNKDEDVAISLNGLASVLREQGKYAESEALKVKSFH